MRKNERKKIVIRLYEERENGRCGHTGRANNGACGSWIGMVVPIGLKRGQDGK